MEYQWHTRNYTNKWQQLYYNVALLAGSNLTINTQKKIIFSEKKIVYVQVKDQNQNATHCLKLLEFTFDKVNGQTVFVKANKTLLSDICC